MKRMSFTILFAAIAYCAMACTIRVPESTVMETTLSQSTDDVTTEDSVQQPTTEDITTEQSIKETTTENTIQETTQKAVFDPEVPDSIKNIVTNNGEFINTGNGSVVTKDTYTVIEDVAYEYVNWEEYAVIDFDQDGINELIANIHPNQGGNRYVVFHEGDGIVYAYPFGVRAMSPIYTDGTISGSSSAREGTIYTISFENNVINKRIFAQSKAMGPGDENVEYYLYDEVVTKEEYFEFMRRQNAKEQIEWMEF